MNEFCFRSACDIARAIREKEVSALEVVETHLRRIEATHSALNAVVTLVADRALDEARAADSRLAGDEPIGALHGVPVTIKDSIETAGILTTGGTTGLANHVPKRDATVVARLRAAGAIVLGKTNTPELTLGGESDNLIFGRTNNPYRLDRTPGGSSGGAAAIIAAGGAALDLGSDVGGSIREPAHFTGIAGIKPTSGRVPGTGHIPASYGALDTFAQIGPMARRVEDIELALGIVAGVDWQDPSVIPMPLGASADIELSRLHVATYTDNGLVAPRAEIAGAVNDATGALAARGVEIVDALPEAIPDAIGLFPRMRAAEGGAPVRAALNRAGTTRRSPRLSYALDFPAPPPGNVLSDLMVELDQVRARMLGFMRDFDAIVCPASPWCAPEHGFEPAERYAAWSHAMAYNATGWPGVTVRAGTGPDGLPIGVQVVARPWREDVAFALARCIESALGGYRPPPEMA